MTSTEKKVAVVTGANTGLGLETSLGLARAGYTVVLACRSEAKATAAMEQIKRQVADASLDFIPLDLVDRQSIRQFAEVFSQRYDHLNVLVNNAGVMGPPYTITQNNLELQFDANHVGHFYLTSLLVDRLDQPYETRIVNVSSLAAKRDHADIHFDNLNFEGTYEEGPKMFGLSGMVAYSQSKLANILFTMEMKDRLQAAGKNIKAVVVHPGVSRTDLSRNMSPMLQFLAPVLVRFMDISKPEQGAESSLYGATKPDVSTGDFIGPTGKDERSGAPGKVPLPPKASDKELCEKLWSKTEELLGISFTL
ncbi:MAG: SDR family NAD(P)-dependent oxidoreductase [Gammaproteobacteria bacterium]|nr:SDR family NAD(P)-dependent oxidoreductase [Gammaproteobacteria bacterium]